MRACGAPRLYSIGRSGCVGPPCLRSQLRGLRALLPVSIRPCCCGQQLRCSTPSDAHPPIPTHPHLPCLCSNVADLASRPPLLVTAGVEAIELRSSRLELREDMKV